MIVLKILGYLALTALALLIALVGAASGIGMFWGKPSGEGSGIFVIIVLIVIAISVSLAALVSYRLLRRQSPTRRNLAFPALTLAFSMVLSPLFTAGVFMSLGIH